MDTQITQGKREIAIHSNYTDFPTRLFFGIIIRSVLLGIFAWNVFAVVPQFTQTTVESPRFGIIDFLFKVGIGLFLVLAYLLLGILALLPLWTTYIRIRNMVLQQPCLKLDEQGILINGHIAVSSVFLAWHEIAMLEVNENKDTRETSFSVYPKNINLFLSRFSRRQRFFWYGLTMGSLSFTVTLQSPNIGIGTYIREAFGDKISTYQIQVRERRE